MLQDIIKALIILVVDKLDHQATFLDEKFDATCMQKYKYMQIVCDKTSRLFLLFFNSTKFYKKA